MGGVQPERGRATTGLSEGARSALNAGLVVIIPVLIVALAIGRGGLAGPAVHGAGFGRVAHPSMPSPHGSVSPSPMASSQAGSGHRLATLPIGLAGKDPRTLYAVAADGSWAAFQDAWLHPGPLHLVRADGTATTFALGPVASMAPLAAAFSPDGVSLAVVDGAGALWIVDLVSRASTRIARAGPEDLVFGRSATFSDARHLYVQLAGSVDVPIPGRIAVVSLPDGAMTLLSDDAWAYRPQPLADGSVAYVHENEDGSYVVRRLDSKGHVRDVASIGFAHGWSAIGAGGDVAFSDGETTWLVPASSGSPTSIGPGAYPRFSPDGRSIAVYDAAAQLSRLMGLDGALIETAGSPFVAIVDCLESC